MDRDAGFGVMVWVAESGFRVKGMGVQNSVWGFSLWVAEPGVWGLEDG